MPFNPLGISAKTTASIAGKSFELAASAVAQSPGKLALLLQAFAPAALANWLQRGRLRIRLVKSQEAMFDKACDAVVSSHQRSIAQMLKEDDELQAPYARATIEAMQRDIRLLEVYRLALAKRPNATSHGQQTEASISEEPPGTDANSAWLDTFESLASRHNEPWRKELLAAALNANDHQPGAISLKAVWEIGMMAADDFGCLAGFCDSAVHVDGKPVVLLSPSQQATFRFELGDRIRVGNLAHAISGLISAGLVSECSTQFDVDEPVELEYFEGKSWLLHTPPAHEKQGLHSVQINGYCPNDIAMDICKLYEPQLNIASGANFDALKEQLLSTENTQEVGRFRFRKTKPKARSSKK